MAADGSQFPATSPVAHVPIAAARHWRTVQATGAPTQPHPAQALSREVGDGIGGDDGAMLAPAMDSLRRSFEVPGPPHHRGGDGSPGDALRTIRKRITWALLRDGGGWRIAHEHTSSPLDTETAKGLFER